MGDTNLPPETIAITEAQRFDERGLAAYLAAGPGVKLLEVRQMSGGQSNPTFLIIAEDNEFVLRKQPPGKLLPSAHAIDREYRVLTALSSTDLPLPRPIFYCDDPAVIGTPFYLMERLRGRIFSQQLLPEVRKEERRSIYFGMAAALRKLHCIDWRAVGLEGFGRPSGYYKRQLERWIGQWQKSKTRENPSVDKLSEWLTAHLPNESESGIIHGDFRLSNIMFDPIEPRVVGVLDWELATLGPPIADVAHSCISYYLPKQLPSSLLGHDLKALGIPEEAEYLDHYRKQSVEGDSLAPFHRAFALFRLAIITEGIVARAKAGNAANLQAMEVGERGLRIADQGWRIAQGQPIIA
jgi:aminoglycoside phosphotransferase (APT) family kinase protein